MHVVTRTEHLKRAEDNAGICVFRMTIWRCHSLISAEARIWAARVQLTNSSVKRRIIEPAHITLRGYEWAETMIIC